MVEDTAAARADMVVDSEVDVAVVDRPATLAVATDTCLVRYLWPNRSTLSNKF